MNAYDIDLNIHNYTDNELKLLIDLPKDFTLIILQERCLEYKNKVKENSVLTKGKKEKLNSFIREIESRLSLLLLNAEYLSLQKHMEKISNTQKNIENKIDLILKIMQKVIEDD